MRSTIISCGLFGLLMVSVIVFAQSNNTDLQTNSNRSKSETRRRNSNTFSPEQITSEEVGFACRFLMQVDAQKILDRRVYLNGTLSSFVDRNFYCNYSVDGQQKDRSQFVRFDIKTFATAEQAQTANRTKIKLNSSMGSQSGIKEIKVTGISNGARLVFRSKNSMSFYFQKSETAFEVTVLGDNNKRINISLLKQIAKRIVMSF